MGWAKYYEDNMSIYIGRMAMRETTSIYKKKEPANIKEAVDNSTKISEVMGTNQNGRRGLELSFQNGIEEKLIKKLQLNGWWWSKANACWCNLDTSGNRRYVERFRGYEGMRLSVVTM